MLSTTFIMCVYCRKLGSQLKICVKDLIKSLCLSETIWHCRTWVCLAPPVYGAGRVRSEPSVNGGAEVEGPHEGPGGGCGCRPGQCPEGGSARGRPTPHAGARRPPAAGRDA